MEKYQQMLEIFNELEGELRLFQECGDRVAGKRARNRLLKIRRLARQLRVDILTNDFPPISKNSKK
jgi:hypothetical protein